jgi:hypothetical protein
MQCAAAEPERSAQPDSTARAKGGVLTMKMSFSPSPLSGGARRRVGSATFDITSASISFNFSLIGAQHSINLLCHFATSRSGVSTGRIGTSNPSAAIDAPPA